MATSQGASTSAVAAHAATQAMQAVQPGDRGGTAVDGLYAGVVALALQEPSVLLGAAVVLIAGIGEGLVLVDGRARQPGLGAQRPRGAREDAPIPDASRVASPGLPGALVRAHAGRGVKTPSALARDAIASVEQQGEKPPRARLDAIRAFAREGAGILRGGAVHEALVAATARSVGGVLTDDDLATVSPVVSTPRIETIGGRAWSSFDHAFPAADDDAPPIEIVAAADTYGAIAIAAVSRASHALALPEVALTAPLVARPVLRGVPRVAPGASLPFFAPIGVARAREDASFDLAAGVAGPPAAARAAFVQVREALGDPSRTLDDAIAALEPAACLVYRGASAVRAVHRRAK